MNAPPAIIPGFDDAPFWQAAAEHRLVFQACGHCGAVRHPPMPRCARCISDAVAWVEAPPVGELFSFTIVPNAEPDSPTRIIALVLFRTLGGVRLVSNIVGAAPGDLRIGMPVEVEWHAYGDGAVPRFHPI